MGSPRTWSVSADPAHDEISRQIDDEGDQEQQDPHKKQNLVMLGIGGGFAQFRRDIRGQRTHRIQDTVRDMHSVAGGHKYRHGLSHRARDTQDHCRRDAGAGGGQQSFRHSLCFLGRNDDQHVADESDIGD